MRFATLVDLLRYRAWRQPDRRAFTFLGDDGGEIGTLTYGELDHHARAIAAGLGRLAEPGARALLLTPSGSAFVTGLFGCFYAGVVAVPVQAPRRNQSTAAVEGIAVDAGAAVVLLTPDIADAVERRAEEWPVTAALPRLVPADAGTGAAGFRLPDVDGRTAAFLQYTSGSTGTPRGVEVTHANVLHNEAMIQEGFEHGEHVVVVGWLPLFHDMGLSGNVLQPVYVGGHCVLMPPAAFLQKPVRWLQAITRYRATTSGGPNFAYEMCVRRITPEQRSGLDLSPWDVAFNGAEPVRAETLDRFAAAFAACGFRREAFYPCYGMAEATLFVTGGDKRSAPRALRVASDALEQHRVALAGPGEPRAQVVTSCGRARGGQRIAIVDPHTALPCPVDHVGEIWVAGPSVGGGYWGREAESAATFRAHLADAGEGPFLRTGDLGFIRDGDLFIVGRLKDLVIVRGRNHAPEDIEATVVHGDPALRHGGTAAFTVEIDGDEQLVVVQEVERDRLRDLDVAGTVADIRERITAEHGLRAHAVILVKPATVPKTSSGKVRRHACRRLYVEGALRRVDDVSAEPSAAPALIGV